MEVEERSGASRGAARLAVLVGGEHRTFLLRIFAAVGPVVMKRGVRRPPNQFFRRKTEHAAGGGIDERDVPLNVRSENALRAGFQNQPRAFLGGPDLFEQFAACGGCAAKFPDSSPPTAAVRPAAPVRGTSTARNDANSITPSKMSADDNGSATACTGAAAPKPEAMRNVARRQICQRNRLALLRALADQTFARLEGFARLRHRRSHRPQCAGAARDFPQTEKRPRFRHPAAARGRRAAVGRTRQTRLRPASPP